MRRCGKGCGFELFEKYELYVGHSGCTVKIEYRKKSATQTFRDSVGCSEALTEIYPLSIQFLATTPEMISPLATNTFFKTFGFRLNDRKKI